ncbi:MAG: aromatic amino acid ammonia-lyase, partial [Thalassotalea sp.]|nr:aromatic amino acid ammonia-lyase [Thalassotalea sp.]
MTFKYGVDRLNLDIVNGIANGSIKAELCQEALDKINTSRKRVEKMAASDKAVYGINTGFGPLCDTQISPEDTNLLQKNLLITHAVGVGEPIDKAISKLMLITKVHALSQGFSGIRLEVVERMLTFIELDLIPVVPEQGSVGASGDLAPLSHLFLPLLGEGEFWDNKEGQNGKIVAAAPLLREHDLEIMDLQAKEGLALINGTQFILSHGITALTKMRYLLDLADMTGAMSIEGMQGSESPFREELHQTRAFKGNLEVAARMRVFFKGSQNMSAHQACDRVQDPYSLRCIPQVHGASRNAYYHLEELVEIEMNSVTDNPIVISSEEAISGGSFHGQPLAMVLDYASIAASELGNISDRRCYLLLEGIHGLPRLLTSAGGLNSGMMIPQYA